jgi:peptidoglycan/LPS O-acetylase OafA/YrhL
MARFSGLDTATGRAAPEDDGAHNRDRAAAGGDRGRQPSRGKLASLTGIRALAAIWVLSFHLLGGTLAAFPGLPAPLKNAIGGGYLGVDLFFILSGFVLAYQYLDRFERVELGPYSRFLALRLARIYPVHLFTLVLTLVLVVAARLAGFPHHSSPEFFGAGSFVANVLLVHAWGFCTGLTWNYPSWSVSCEFLAYLAFPFIAARLRLIRNPVVAAAIVVAGIVGCST